MSACNYFYLSTSAITPLRSRIVIIHDAGLIADALFNDLIYYIDEIIETLDYYAPYVKKGLGNYE